ISISYPLPGTTFYERVKSQLKLKQHWSDSDDLAMMFTGTYPPEYYRILYQYIHNRYRVQRGARVFGSSSPVSVRQLASMIYNLPFAWMHRYQLQKIEHAHGVR